MQVPANQNVFNGSQHDVVVYASLRRPSGFDRSATLLGRVPQARRATVHYVRRTEAKLVYANITGKATP
jgi:hypothetical protein